MSRFLPESICQTFIKHGRTTQICSYLTAGANLSSWRDVTTANETRARVHVRVRECVRHRLCNTDTVLHDSLPQSRPTRSPRRPHRRCPPPRCFHVRGDGVQHRSHRTVENQIRRRWRAPRRALLPRRRTGKNEKNMQNFIR